MKFNARTGSIILNLLAAVGALGYGLCALDGLDEETASLVKADTHWLGFTAGLFCLNLLVAWRYRNVWAVSSVRMLIWAVIAYLGISHLVDLVGQNWDLAVNAAKLGTDTDTVALVTGLRARIAAVAVVVSLSITGIAVGFESERPESG